jgi:hypothetical protein
MYETSPRAVLAARPVRFGPGRGLRSGLSKNGLSCRDLRRVGPMASGYYNPVCVEKRSFAVVCPSTFFVGNRQYEPGYKPLMISAAQSRAARGLVEWSQEQLAVESHLGLSTIRDFEKGRRAPTHNNLLGIKMALESAGVVFVAAGPEGGRRREVGKNAR